MRWGSQGRFSRRIDPEPLRRPCRSAASAAAFPPASSRTSIPTLRVSRYPRTSSEIGRAPAAALAQRVDDAGHCAGGCGTEEREREVKVLSRHDAAGGEVLVLPAHDPVDDVVGEPQRAEEP